MKKYLTIIVLTLIWCELHSQQEYKISMGTVLSGDQGYSSYIDFMGSDSWNNNTVFNNSYSPRVGLDLNLGYSYYIKYNFKVSTSLSYVQTGYRSIINSYNSYDLIQKSFDNKINLNYLRTSIGVTYVTKYGFTLTAGHTINNLLSGTLKQEGSVVYTNSPSNSYIVDNQTDLTYYTPYDEYDEEVYQALGNTDYSTDFSNISGPYFGFGYEWGDLSIDYIFSSPSNGSSDNSFDFINSICVGYSKLIKSNK